MADKYDSEMPPIPGIDEIDVEILEQTTMKVNRQASLAKKESGGDASGAANASSSGVSVEDSDNMFVSKSKAQQRREFYKTLPVERQEVIAERQKARRKAKRKHRLPAGYDPKNPGQPDPERWIPKRDRTSYKKTRKEKAAAKNKIKGSQGAGKVNENLDRSGPAKESSSRAAKGKGRRKR